MKESGNEKKFNFIFNELYIWLFIITITGISSWTIFFQQLTGFDLKLGIEKISLVKSVFCYLLYFLSGILSHNCILKLSNFKVNLELLLYGMISLSIGILPGVIIAFFSIFFSRTVHYLKQKNWKNIYNLKSVYDFISGYLYYFSKILFYIFLFSFIHSVFKGSVPQNKLTENDLLLIVLNSLTCSFVYSLINLFYLRIKNIIKISIKYIFLYSLINTNLNLR